MPRHGAATFDRAAKPLSAVRHLGDGREPQYRLSRLARFSGMAQARRPLLCLPAAGRARAAGFARVLTACLSVPIAAKRQGRNPYPQTMLVDTRLLTEPVIGPAHFGPDLRTRSWNEAPQARARCSTLA